MRPIVRVLLRPAARPEAGFSSLLWFSLFESETFEQEKTTELHEGLPAENNSRATMLLLPAVEDKRVP